MILVTGGAGFIGSNFVKYLVDDLQQEVAVVDNLTYAGDIDNLKDIEGDVHFTKADIRDHAVMRGVFQTYAPEAVFHFAAESHVDNSIKDSLPFLETNVLGTANLLEVTREFISVGGKFNRFHHISTDEVYGTLGEDDPPFTETTPYAPRSPYAATKASSDHLVASYGNTYGIPYNITNCSNNYGIKQHKEKLIPTVIRKALRGDPVPMYGNGENIRDWIHVQDHCEAIWKVYLDSKSGTRYNIGGKCQLSNITLIKKILSIMNKPESLISMVEDRPGHDFRYDIDNTKIETELGWSPKVDMELALEKTIEWYIEKWLP